MKKDAGWEPASFLFVNFLVSATATTTTAIAASSSATTAAAKTTTTTAAATAKAAASTATKSPTTAAGFGAGFIHVQRARSQLISVHCADGFFCFFVICH